MKTGESLKYLGGGWIVYVVMASCSGPSARPNGAQTMGGTSGGVPADTAAGADSGASSGSPVPDANAQEAGRGTGTDSCGTCNVPSPLTVQSAENDVTRWVTGTKYLVGAIDVTWTSAPLLTGPLVVSTLSVSIGKAGVVFWLSESDACSFESAAVLDPIAVLSLGASSNTGGTNFSGRLLVPPGKVLCGGVSGSVAVGIGWTGFKPG